LERIIHPVYSRQLDERLAREIEAEKNSPEAYTKEMDTWFGDVNDND